MTKLSAFQWAKSNYTHDLMCARTEGGEEGRKGNEGFTVILVN